VEGSSPRLLLHQCRESILDILRGAQHGQTIGGQCLGMRPLDAWISASTRPKSNRRQRRPITPLACVAPPVNRPPVAVVALPTSPLSENFG
jgi:hypothetical protein